MANENQNTFETGATNAAANNLVLSVLNDGQVYNDRLHCGFSMLQGSNHRLTFKDIVTNEANKQRREFGARFKPQEITEATKIIQKETIRDCLELIQNEYNKEKDIIANCRRWFDKVNGNSYFSVNIQIPMRNGKYRQINIPMQYGYGNHWQYEVIDLLEKIGVIHSIPYYENGNKNYGYLSEYPVEFIDYGYMPKRNMFDGMYI